MLINDVPGALPEQLQTPPAPVRKPRRTRRSARQAGSSFEQQIASWLAERLGNDFIERRTKNGRNDRGDLSGIKTIRGGRVVCELKNYGGEYKVKPWLDEAALEAGNDDAPIGVVIAKKRGTTDPANQVVFMDVETFARLLEGGGDEYRF